MKTTEEIIQEIERRIMEVSRFIENPYNEVAAINFRLLLDWIKSNDEKREE